VVSELLARLAYRPSEASEVLGVSDDFFREHVQHELRWIRRGRVKLVARAELERWLDQAAARTLDDGDGRFAAASKAEGRVRRGSTSGVAELRASRAPESARARRAS
jgi:excisionase family DNA binding protein